MLIDKDQPPAHIHGGLCTGGGEGAKSAMYDCVVLNGPAVGEPPDVMADEAGLTEDSDAGARLTAVLQVLTATTDDCRVTVSVLRAIHRQPGTVQSHVRHTT